MPKRKDQIAKLLTDDSFIRWVYGNANKSECNQWEQWLQADIEHRFILKEAKELLHALQFEEHKPNTPGQWKSIESILNAEEMRKKPLHSIKTYKNSWLRVAAALILLAAVITVVQYMGWRPDLAPEKEKVAAIYETIQTDYGEVKHITLSNGSKITLNAHSSLRYPVTQKEGNIEVKLEGEAYFSIVHKYGKQQRSFSVTTSEGRVTVLGTKFNVNTYSQSTEVVLEKGKVKLKRIDTTGTAVDHYTMSPGELGRMSGQIEVSGVNPELYTSWKDFELKFKNTPLIKITERIKQIYGVEIVFRQNRLKNIEFSGSIPNKNITVLLKALRTLLDTEISHQENTIIFGAKY